jgi:hypothetical protein
MRFDLRHRVVRLAFLGALMAGGAPALAAGQTASATGSAATHQAKASGKAEAAHVPTPSASPRSEKTAAATPAPRAAGAPSTSPPATGPKVQTRRGRGHF